MAKNAKGKPVNAEGKVVKRAMPTDQPLTFWYKRKGYNDFLVSILLCGNAHSPPAKCNQIAFLSSNFTQFQHFAPWSHLMRHVPQHVASDSRATCVCCASCFAGISQTKL